MKIRLLASVVIAALLMTGAINGPRGSEYGTQAQQTTPPVVKGRALADTAAPVEAPPAAPAGTAPREKVPEPPAETTAPPPAEKQPTAEAPVPSAAAEKLTREKALAIALDHAGLTEAMVTGLRGEYDVDDGVPEWDVEFRRDGWEYEYEIHGETGKILSWDKDYDD